MKPHLLPLYLAFFFCLPSSAGEMPPAPAAPVAAVPPVDLSFYTTEPAAIPAAGEGKTKNVILLIGDGMGLSQTALAALRAGGSRGLLHLHRLPVTGLALTAPADGLVTDSAAAGTALATGFKTRNGMIGQTPDGKRKTTLLEAARAKGLATGIIATSTVSHATPASFAAHVASRGSEEEIALQMSEAPPDVLLGGGRAMWSAARKDGRDLIGALREKGWAIVGTAEELAATEGPRVLGLFQDGALTTLPPEPSLAVLVEKALGLLGKHPAGFVLMVEGSQIDWMCHNRNAEEAVRQTLLFDLAVRAASAFAAKDGETLVVVTADHETGGLVVLGGEPAGSDIKTSWAGKDHTPTPVLVHAGGPGAAAFTGTGENTEIPRKIAARLGLALDPAE